MANKNSDAKLRANNKYREKTYEQISLIVHKGKRDYYKNKATELGYSSLNAFIISAINEKIKKEDS